MTLMDESPLDPGTLLPISRRVVRTIVFVSAALAWASPCAGDDYVLGPYSVSTPENIFTHEALQVAPLSRLSALYQNEGSLGDAQSTLPGLKMQYLQPTTTIAGRQSRFPTLNPQQRQVPSPAHEPAVTTSWPDHTASTDFNATELLGRLVRGTFTVLVLLGLSLWGLRQWMKRNQNATPPTGSLSVVDSKVLSGRCQLQLVEVDGHRVLVGIDAGGVKCVTILPDKFADALSVAEAEDDGDLVSLNMNRVESRPNQTTLAVGQPA